MLVEAGPITEVELNWAIWGTRREKAPGPDGIPDEAWAILRGARAELLAFLNLCWGGEGFPAKWRARRWLQYSRRVPR